MGRTEAAYRERIRAKYNQISDIWGGHDRWHAWTRHQIERAMRRTLLDYLPQLHADPLVIDVGSGGDSYGIDVTRRIDIDIAEHRLGPNGWSVCANGEALPIMSDVADLVICVGPVINYCSFEEALRELTRISKQQGFIVLHVELSNSWEFFGSDDYRADAAFVETFYKGKEALWVYGEGYVRRIALAAGLKMLEATYFHFASSFIYRLTHRADFAAFFAPLDVLFRHLPFSRGIADSAIYFFQKVD